MGGWTREYLLSLPTEEYEVLIDMLTEERTAAEEPEY